MYESYDVSSGELLSSYNGLGFTRYNNILYYIKPQPYYYQGDKGFNEILDEFGNILYTSESNCIIEGNLYFSNEGKIAFCEFNIENNEYIIYYGNLSDLNNGDFSNLNKKVFDSDASIDEIKWNGENLFIGDNQIDFIE